MLRERVIVWFRQDLRLHDNEALFEAIRQSKEVIPVFVLDERQIFGKTSFEFPKIGKFRMKFLLESIEDLRSNLKKLGSDLIVRVGHTENILINKGYVGNKDGTIHFRVNPEKLSDYTDWLEPYLFNYETINEETNIKRLLNICQIKE